MPNQNPLSPSPSPGPGPAEARRPRVPRWTAREQDLWIDLLEGYSSCLLTARADGERLSEEQGAELIRQAALLADAAIKEVEYRFWIQRPAVRTARGKAKRPTRRAGRRSNR